MLNFRLTGFQSMIIWMIQSLTLLQIVYSFMWNTKVFLNCEFWSRISAAVIDTNMFLIGILVIYYMYSTVNMIHQFAKKGRLPREQARRRLKCCIYFMVFMCGCLLATYISLEFYFKYITNYRG